MYISLSVIIRTFIVSFIFMIFGCVSFEKELLEDGYKSMSRDEIVATLSGNTLYGIFFDTGSTVTVLIESNGKLRAKSVTPSGDIRTDQGQWEASDKNLFCDQWLKWQQVSDCDRLYRRDNKIVFVNLDGSRSAAVVIEQGNSRGL